MNKLIVLISVSLMMLGCSDFNKGGVQPVLIKNAKEKIMFTTCSGMADDWGGCFNRARKTCPSGYHTVSEFQDSSGIRRELTFKCE